jgi:predicted dehydrogenase
MRTIRFGVIGCGLMGKEFASAAARWCHLNNMPARPEIVAASNRSEGPRQWFTGHFDSVRQSTPDYREVLANPDVEAVYIAVPHHLHEEVYVAALEAGKHVFGEKPFGIDLPANNAILEAASRHPNLLVRCCSQFPYFPAVQMIGRMIQKSEFGAILEVNAGFLHSSDLNPDKPANWKRMVEFNGEYGVMGDLGMHVCHVPFRAGWIPRNVRAVLSNVVTERPDGKGGRTACGTWDNATLLCEAADASGQAFPLTLRTQRMAPGESNTWYLEIKGTKACAKFSTRQANVLHLLHYNGGAQEWREVCSGYQPAFPAITGPIFEFGFTDAILQMWAAFVSELAGAELPDALLARAATPAEANLSHRLFTAALHSAQTSSTSPLAGNQTFSP